MDTSTSFNQEWFLTDCILFKNTKFVVTTNWLKVLLLHGNNVVTT